MKSFIEKLEEDKNREQDLEKVQKSIKSCKTKEQAKSCAKLIKNYYDKHSKGMAPGQKIKFMKEVDKIRKELRDFMKKKYKIELSKRNVGLIL